MYSVSWFLLSRLITWSPKLSRLDLGARRLRLLQRRACNPRIACVVEDNPPIADIPKVDDVEGRVGVIEATTDRSASACPSHKDLIVSLPPLHRRAVHGPVLARQVSHLAGRRLGRITGRRVATQVGVEVRARVRARAALGHSAHMDVDLCQVGPVVVSIAIEASSFYPRRAVLLYGPLSSGRPVTSTV